MSITPWCSRCCACVGQTDGTDTARVTDRVSGRVASSRPHCNIDGSRMQISFLKDLATLRNPCSRFTFLNYLHSQKRLIDFINRGTFTPTRLEFADYLAWVAREVITYSAAPSASFGDENEKLSPRLLNSIELSYGERVLAVEGIRGSHGDIEFLQVLSTKHSDNALHQYLCRNLIISVGGTARIPKPFQGLLYEPPKKSCNVIHTSTFLHHIDRILRELMGIVTAYPNHSHENRPESSISPPSRSHSSISMTSSPSSDGLPDSPFTDQHGSESPSPLKIAVIGAGQSAAETLLETYNRIKPFLTHLDSFNVGVEIDLIIKQGNLRPSDDSPFSNQVFNPKSTDFFYELCAEALSKAHNRSLSNQGSNKLTDFLLKEAASTNYAVVSPETLKEIHEIMYAQKIKGGTETDLLRDSHRCQEPRINIINYTEVIEAVESPSHDGSINVLLENVLTGQRTSSRYHAMILGTGYHRQSWKEILFGRSTDYRGSGVNLGDLWPDISIDSSKSNACSGDLPSIESSTSSIISSGSSDCQGNDGFCHAESPCKVPYDVKVARNYRLLLPTTFCEPGSSGMPTQSCTIRNFRPTVWLQGCNESTHGISDTLLSVLSIRSEEIYHGIKQEGWFGGIWKPRKWEKGIKARQDPAPARKYLCTGWLSIESWK